MNSTSRWLAHIGLALALIFAAGVADAAAGGKIKKPVSKEHAAKMKQRAISSKERQLRQLTSRIDGMVNQIRDFQNRNQGDLMADNQVKARMHDLAARQGRMKRALTTLKYQTVEQYAASRNIPLIPAPPQGAPPPLPNGPAPNSGALAVPTQAIQPSKAALPPGAPPVIKTQAPQI